MEEDEALKEHRGSMNKNGSGKIRSRLQRQREPLEALKRAQILLDKHGLLEDPWLRREKPRRQ
eukprot:12413720-Karenia_brevis.AAC.1